MPYRICKTLEIENGHMLSLPPDKCRFPHGHTRKVGFVLWAAKADAAGMVCDIKIIMDAVGAYPDGFDHSLCMNTADAMYPVAKEARGGRVIGFDNTEPTTEVMAREFFTACTSHLRACSADSASRHILRASVRPISLRVWETSSSLAGYSI